MPEFVLIPPRVGDQSIFAPLFRSPIVDEGADAIVAAASAVGDFFDPRTRILIADPLGAPFVVWGPDILPAAEVLPMWNADP